MVFYTQKFDEKISSKKRDNFSQKHNKVNSIFYLNFILKPWFFPLGLY